MKVYTYYIIAILLAISCSERKPKELFILKSSKDVSIVNDIVFFKREKFSGVLFELNSSKKDTVLLEKYEKGLLNGTCKKWFSNNHLMESREYKLGWKNGKQIAFWENGNKRFEFTAKNDAYEGEMKEWSVAGKLFHLANFVNGQEEGIQKMWYENGKIRANYVILNGKRYGLLGTKNCKNVSDSIFVVK
jgi:antitoxin component YwqK of YwqJK toxin-antitoxin module